MFRKPLFWIILCLLNILAVIYIIHNLPAAFSMLEVETTMNRSSSLHAADSLHNFLDIKLSEYRQATIFTGDNQFQNYVELKGGGTQVLRQVIEDDVYEPFYWYVRHFKEDETRELNSYFTPTGQVWGFEEKVPETEEGPALTRDNALAKADSLARYKWNIDMDKYTLVESAQDEKPNGRIDHRFTYEREDVQVEEAKYRLRLVVSGDRLTALRPHTWIPESFRKEFTQMYSFNMTLATAASGAMILLYGIAIIAWLITYIRRRQLIFKPALKWALVIAIASIASSLNFFSFSWFGYDTSTSSSLFILQRLLMIFINGFFMAALSLIVIIIAEAVTRQAFPGKIQFWRLADKDTASSKPVLGMVLGSYLTVPVALALTVAFYIFTSNRFGWWIPSRAITNPNILAAFSPAISAISIGLTAGFWEEAMFRALPLATMAIIGVKLNKKTLFLVIGIILQSVIFSAAHANYPQQPYYFRLVELIIPSMIFAFLYLRVNLVSAIIVHFAYNAFWGALSFFTMDAPGLWLDRTIFIILFFLPLIYVFYCRMLSKDWRVDGKRNILKSIYRFFFSNWQEVPAHKLNSAYRAEAVESYTVDDKQTAEIIDDEHTQQEERTTEQLQAEPSDDEITTSRQTTSKNIRLSSMSAVFLSVIVLIAGVILNSSRGRPQDYPEPRLEITAGKAVEIANQSLAEWLDDELPEEFNAYPDIYQTPLKKRFFVVKENGKDAYRELLDNYIFEDAWQISYKRFTGDLDERFEQYTVFMTSRGSVFNISHRIPEAREGAHLSEDEARRKAYDALQELPGYEQMGLRDISVSPIDRPNRTDWNITVADTLSPVLEVGQERITVRITGDKVTNVNRFIFIPEDNERELRALSQRREPYLAAAIILLIFLGAGGAGFALVKVAHKKMRLTVFKIIFAAMFLITLLEPVVGWRKMIGEFNTVQPFNNQLIIVIIVIIISAVFYSALSALLFAFCRQWQMQRNPRSMHKSTVPFIIIALVVTFISLLFLSGRPAHEANILNLPGFEPALTASSFLFTTFSLISTFIIYFGLISYLFYIIEKLSDKGKVSQMVGYLFFIAAGMVSSLLWGFPYHTTPFTWVVPLRGLVIALALYILFTVTTKTDKDNWLTAAVIVSGIIPVTGIIHNPFPGAWFAYLFSYIVIITGCCLFRKLIPRNTENSRQ